MNGMPRGLMFTLGLIFSLLVTCYLGSQHHVPYLTDPRFWM